MAQEIVTTKTPFFKRFKQALTAATFLFRSNQSLVLHLKMHIINFFLIKFSLNQLAVLRGHV
jgi:hypothetical protein